MLLAELRNINEVKGSNVNILNTFAITPQPFNVGLLQYCLFVFSFRIELLKDQFNDCLINFGKLWINHQFCIFLCFFLSCSHIVWTKFHFNTFTYLFLRNFYKRDTKNMYKWIINELLMSCERKFIKYPGMGLTM